MSSPNFIILSDTELYTNSLTPLELSAYSSNLYSSNFHIWDFGDGYKARGERVRHVYESVGDYEITLTQFLSSGEPVQSDPKIVSVRNLIPNLLKWSDESPNGDSIVASTKSLNSFKPIIFNSWQQYDENSFLNLYAENSKSIPFDITDKKIHLKPNWRFLDVYNNVINQLPINYTKIYAQILDGDIYLDTKDSLDSVFVGVSAQSEFYFVDDTPSGIDLSDDFYPTTMIITQNLSSIYGDHKFSSEDYIQYPSLIKHIYIDNIIPNQLKITSNGVFDIDGIKYVDTKIPFNIRVTDLNSNFIKTSPIANSSISSYEIEIGFTSNLDIASIPPMSGNSLEQFNPDLTNFGGFFDSYFIPYSPTTGYTSLTASTKVDYNINKSLSRYGIFSDENSNKIFRVSYFGDLGKEYIRKDSDVIGNEYDKFTSNKFGTLIDTKYNAVFLDSDDSRIEMYNTAFELISSIELSSYDDFILTTTITTQLSGDAIIISQLGDDIYGVLTDEGIGSSLAINDNGNLVAIGTYDADYGTNREGGVKVYKLSPDNNWVQLGQLLSGDSSLDAFGKDIDMNSDGDILAAVSYGTDPTDYARIYQLSSNNWVQLGSDILGEGMRSIALNNGGNIVATGRALEDVSASNAGQVKVFQYSGGSWNQIGSDINGDESFDAFGSSISLNNVGDILAVGATGFDDGQVKVFQYSGGSWSQMGNDITDIISSSSDFGYSLKLNGDGDRIIIGASRELSISNNDGQVKVFQYSGGSWSQIGGTLVSGNIPPSAFGHSVDINGVGDRIIIGAPSDSGMGFSNGGIAQLYDYIDNDWVQISNTLSGGIDDGFFGYSVALTKDGSRFTVSAQSDDTNIIDGGKVNVYELQTSISNELSSDRGHPSPAQIQMDKEGDYFITLHETADLLYVIDNEVKKIDLYDQIAGDFVTLSGDAVIYEDPFGLSSYVYYDSDGGFLFQPAALDVLSDNETIYVAYTNEGYNFVQKYKLDRTTDPYGLSSLAILPLSSDVPVDMVSNRDGSKLYVLTTNYYDNNSDIKEYDTYSDLLLSSICIVDDSNIIAKSVWSFEEEGMIDENKTPYGVRIYTSDDIPVDSLWGAYDDGVRIRASFQDGTIPGGSVSDFNNLPQTGTATTTITTPFDNYTVMLNFSGMGELAEPSGAFGSIVGYQGDAVYEDIITTANASGDPIATAETMLVFRSIYDISLVLLDGNIIGIAHSPGGGIEDGSVGPIVSYPPTGLIDVSLNQGDHDLMIHTTTVDDFYHFGAYFDIKIIISNSKQRGGSEFITIDTDQNIWATVSKNSVVSLKNNNINIYSVSDVFGGNEFNDIGGIAGDSYGNIWLLDSDNNRNIVFNKDDLSDYELINITEDQPITINKYVAYGDWNGFRWYNKFGYGGEIITYTLSGESDPFIVYPQGKYNLQKINEDFDMTETLKSYRTTESMLEYDHLFNDFLGSIFGDTYDDGTKFGRNIYEKIANFVLNHSDVDTCSVEALKSLSEEVGVDFEMDIVYPRDVKRIVDLFSIKYKKLWGDLHQTGIVEDYKGGVIDISSYEVSADPQVNFIATEKFNEYNTIIKPLIVSDTLSTYPLSNYSFDWGWGLSVPDGGELSSYYDFYELLPIDSTKIGSIIDWDHPLTDNSIEGLSSYSNYMNDDGIVSTILGDTLRRGLNLYED